MWYCLPKSLWPSTQPSRHSMYFLGPEEATPAPGEPRSHRDAISTLPHQPRQPSNPGGTVAKLRSHHHLGLSVPTTADIGRRGFTVQKDGVYQSTHLMLHFRRFAQNNHFYHVGVKVRPTAYRVLDYSLANSGKNFTMTGLHVHEHNFPPIAECSHRELAQLLFSPLLRTRLRCTPTW